MTEQEHINEYINNVNEDWKLMLKYSDASYWKTYNTNYQFKPKVIVKKKKLTENNNSVK